MAIITRNVCGIELNITLTEEEIRNVIAEHATITVKPFVTEPEPPKEPKKQWHTVKTRRVGALEDHTAEIIEMYQQGMSLEQVGRHYGVYGSTISDHLKKHGIKVRTQKEAWLVRLAKHSAA